MDLALYLLLAFRHIHPGLPGFESMHGALHQTYPRTLQLATQLGYAIHHPREYDAPVPVSDRIWLRGIEKSLSYVARRKCQEPPKGSHTTSRTIATIGTDSARALVPLIHACGNCNEASSIDFEISLLDMDKRSAQAKWKAGFGSRPSPCNAGVS
jgi:hypothetical protein